MTTTIYSTTTCGFCKMLKKYLDDKGVKYVEKMADSDETIAKELYEKSHQLSVPFTQIVKDDNTTVDILGFDVPKLNSALGL
ncbi:MAG: glutaredoxin family protein [Patescibacteria group bacterium]